MLLRFLVHCLAEVESYGSEQLVNWRFPGEVLSEAQGHDRRVVGALDLHGGVEQLRVNLLHYVSLRLLCSLSMVLLYPIIRALSIDEITKY